MSKFTCKNDTLVLSPFPGVVKKRLIPLFSQFTVKRWLRLCGQPSECLGYPDPGLHVQAGCVPTVATIPPMPLVYPDGQTYSNLSQWQFLLLPQHNSNKYKIQSKCYLGPQGFLCLGLCVSCKTVEDSLCYVLSKNLWINLILSAYALCICKYCSRQHSLSS